MVQISHRYGMILFIASEVMFFVAWFWAYFDVRAVPERGQGVRPHRLRRRRVAAEGHQDLRSLAPAAAQYAYFAHLRHDGDLGPPFAAGERPQRPELGAGADHPARHRRLPACKPSSTAHAAFHYSGNIYGATFFMATGFHGAHVIIGTIFLIVCLIRALAGQFTPTQHLGFEFAAWYWHFVDVVWLFLFACIYVWGSGGVPE